MNEFFMANEQLLSGIGIIIAIPLSFLVFAIFIGMLHIPQIRYLIADFFVGLLYFVSIRYLLVTYTSLSNTACICISFFLSVFVLPNPVAIYQKKRKQLDKEVPTEKTGEDDKNTGE